MGNSLPCPDCNGGDPPCYPCSDCGGCIHNQCFTAESELDYLENWHQNRVLEDELHTFDATEIIENIRLKREIERVDREWAYVVAVIAKNVPCEIDKKELAEIAKKPLSVEYSKQVDEIVKKHFPELAAAVAAHQGSRGNEAC